MSRYFDEDAFAFFRALARNNNRPWFHAHKARYLSAVRDPFLRLIADLAGPLAQLAPHFRADPKPVGGSLFRIQRDTRFAADKKPYKTWAGARFPHARAREVPAPSFYLHLEPGRCFVGAGLWHPEPAVRRRVREFMVDNPGAWSAVTAAPAFRRRFALDGDSLKRPPRGYLPDHPLIEDLKRQDFVATRALDDALFTGPRLLRGTVSSFQGLAPFVDYLCAALDLEL
ncbi:MAG TPA: DUF2461 domain-containing protein [Xanthomonadaceae bacterium]|nr:DUF2461 domain-containing protein [Xanthomonadaceae bacterium]